MQTWVLLYDDNEALRESIKLFVQEEPGIDILALPSAETVEEDMNKIKPDVILMDIDMPSVNGVEAVRRIRLKDADIPIIMLTVFDDNENIFNSICAGASGYILKRYASVELMPAIRNVLSGGAPMTGSVARKVLTMMPRESKAEKADNGLSERETEILQLLVQGYSYKMISQEIHVSIDTVRFHIKKIYDKLHVHSATEAVSKALKDKLV